MRLHTRPGTIMSAVSKTSSVITDVLAIALFALLARMAHQSEEMPFNFAGWLETLWPFLLGVALAWIVITLATWDGARLAPAGLSAWIITASTGLIIWGVKNGAVPHISFIIVAGVMSGLLMLGWRAAGMVAGRR